MAERALDLAVHRSQSRTAFGGLLVRVGMYAGCGGGGGGWWLLEQGMGSQVASFASTHARAAFDAHGRYAAFGGYVDWHSHALCCVLCVAP
jgi:hypothetical protein